MHFSAHDDHDEDDLPVISLPRDLFPARRDFRENYQPDNTENDYPTRLIGNWRNLYQTSLQSLQGADEEPRSSIETPYYFGRPTTTPDSHNPIETFSSSLVYRAPPTEDTPPSSSSAYVQPQIEPDVSATKWQIRLPELLNCTVGPDRQKRNIARRHTTTVVFQVSDRRNPESNTVPVDRVENGRSMIPIVKQLRQKFDQMTSNDNDSIDTRRTTSLSSWSSRPKLSRASSLTSRSFPMNTNERPVRTPRPMLPVRPSAELTTVRSRASSSGSTIHQPTLSNGRASRERSGPPVSYSKHFYPPPSTTTVVKQLLDSGASLVYDSTSQPDASQRRPSTVRHQRSIDKRTEDFRNSNSTLTGGSLPPDTTSDTYAKIKRKAPVRPASRPFTDDQSENIYSEPIVQQSSNSSVEKPTFQTFSRQPWNNRKTSTVDEAQNYYAVYDMNK